MSRKIVMEADRSLFDEVRDILFGMMDFLPSIVQNDMEITFDDWLDFLDRYEKFVNQLDDWLVKVKSKKREVNKGRRKGDESR